jgi:hypothetical protein
VSLEEREPVSTTLRMDLEAVVALATGREGVV